VNIVSLIEDDQRGVICVNIAQCCVDFMHAVIRSDEDELPLSL
jgi:hypothetical protein